MQWFLIEQMQSMVFFLFASAIAFVPQIAGAEELSTAQSPDPGVQANDELRLFESWAQVVEALLVGGAILLLLGLNQCHVRGGRRKSPKLDKMGFENGASFPHDFRSGMSKLPSARRLSGGGNAKLGGSGKTAAGKASHRGTTSAADPPVSQEKVRMSERLLSFARKGDVEHATKTLRIMEERFERLPLPDYTCVITMCAKCNDPIGANKWLRRVMEVGLPPNHICFNAVINAFAKMGDLDQAMALAEEMKKHGLEFDTVTYNTFIDAAARAGDAKGAQTWMQSMLDAGVKASVVSFGSVMRACAQAGLEKELEHWTQQAGALGIQLNAICFNAVIRAFVQNGDLVTASNWLTRMMQTDIPPSMPCFLAVVEAVLDTGDVERAAAIIERIRQAKLEPDAGTFSSAVVATCRAGCLDLAQTWANQAVAAGRRLSKGAERALLAANLVVPERGTFPASEVFVNSGADTYELASNGCANDSVKWTRQSCVGKRFVGTIKEFISCKFGHIVCEETYAVFKRDVFLCAQDNPEQLGRGQRVSFTLQIEKRSGLPRACDISVYTPYSMALALGPELPGDDDAPPLDELLG